MADQPRYHLGNCPYCAGREPVPERLRHCDFCHRNYTPDQIHYFSNSNRADGTMKGICEFCVETN